jgi:hypothetical protein
MSTVQADQLPVEQVAAEFVLQGGGERPSAVAAGRLLTLSEVGTVTSSNPISDRRVHVFGWSAIQTSQGTQAKSWWVSLLVIQLLVFVVLVICGATLGWRALWLLGKVLIAKIAGAI